MTLSSAPAGRPFNAFFAFSNGIGQFSPDTSSNTGCASGIDSAIVTSPEKHLRRVLHNPARRPATELFAAAVSDSSRVTAFSGDSINFSIMQPCAAPIRSDC